MALRVLVSYATCNSFLLLHLQSISYVHRFYFNFDNNSRKNVEASRNSKLTIYKTDRILGGGEECKQDKTVISLPLSGFIGRGAGPNGQQGEKLARRC